MIGIILRIASRITSQNTSILVSASCHFVSYQHERKSEFHLYPYHRNTLYNISIRLVICRSLKVTPFDPLIVALRVFDLILIIFLTAT